MSSAHHRTRRVAAVLAAAAVVVASTSGCAVVARGLVVAETLTTVRDITRPTSGTRTLEAVVDGTGGDGLRLREEPGGRRIALLEEGEVVRWSCRRTGPSAEGPRGTTTAWARVTSADGETGFASGAYLRGEEDVEALPTCPP
jgi:hypothetical protein